MTANPVNYLVLAVIFGLLNALVKPLLKLLTCPFILLTLGLFTLLINTGLFYLTGWLGQQFDYGFYVSGFWAAFLGAIVVSIIGMIGEMIFRDELKDRRRHKHPNAARRITVMEKAPYTIQITSDGMGECRPGTASQADQDLSYPARTRMIISPR